MRTLSAHRASRLVVASALSVCVVAGAGTNTTVSAQPAAPEAAVCRADNPAAQAMLPQVDSVLRRWIGVHPHSTTPGMSVAVVAPDPTNRSKPVVAVINCGVTALGGSAATTSATVYEIGSQTKLFTATALAQMSRTGRVQLSDPLQTRVPGTVSIPEAPCGEGAGDSITLQDLATHNAGLIDNPQNATWSASNPQGHSDYTRADLYAPFASDDPSACRSLQTVPGTHYSYSNLGFALLGTALADLHTPNTLAPDFGRLVSDFVTGPLGMTATVLEPIPPSDEMAAPTCPTGVDTPCNWNNVDAFAGGGGMVSTIDDMGTYVAANLGFDKNTQIWPALQQTQRPVGYGPACPTTPTCQGLAWSVVPSGDLAAFPVLTKDGGTWGMHSQTYLLPDACWGIALLSNSTEPSAVDGGGAGGELISALAPQSSLCAPTTPPLFSS